MWIVLHLQREVSDIHFMDYSNWEINAVNEDTRSQGFLFLYIKCILIRRLNVPSFVFLLETPHYYKYIIYKLNLSVQDIIMTHVNWFCYYFGFFVEVDPCDSVKCVRGWCEAYYNSTTCVCHDGFWGYLCEHEGRFQIVIAKIVIAQLYEDGVIFYYNNSC